MKKILKNIDAVLTDGNHFTEKIGDSNESGHTVESIKIITEDNIVCVEYKNKNHIEELIIPFHNIKEVIYTPININREDFNI